MYFSRKKIGLKIIITITNALEGQSFLKPLYLFYLEIN